MTEINHDFLLLNKLEHAYTDYVKRINNPNAIQIHDDLMNYIGDSLKGVTCYNPARKMEVQKGLNFYGPTVIKNDGAKDAERVLSAWVNLFSSGPKRIQLTGTYSSTEGKPGIGSYSSITIDRDEIVDKLKTVASYANRVASSDELFILHLGI